MSMDWYDPEVDLDADDWLAADGLEKIRLVEEYHRDEVIGISAARVKCAGPAGALAWPHRG